MPTAFDRCRHWLMLTSASLAWLLRS